MQENRPSHPPQSDVVAHTMQKLPSYTISDNGLEMGASLGNSALWVTTKGTGAIDRIFSVEEGESLINAVSIRYAGPGLYSFASDKPADAKATTQASYVGLRQDSTGTFEIHPAYQRHHFSIAGGLDVTETTFVPIHRESTEGSDAPLVYQQVHLQNTSTFAYDLRIFGFARLRGTLADDVSARYDEGLRAIVAHNEGHPEAVRVFGVTETPSGFASSFDFGRVYDPLHVRPLENTTDARGDILGCLQLDVHLEAGMTHSFAFITSLSGRGEEAAIRSYREAGDPDEVLRHTCDHLSKVLAHSQVMTPDPLINQGALWSKINMLRVMSCYPQGPAFTNEPGVSSNVVGRDAAWFVYGNDHFLPLFSRALLDTFARFQYENGKIPEYYSAIDGHVEDYGLNINDDTPLFLLAVNHHYRAAGDVEWLRRIYPAVAKAARYIVAQRDERGLVYCSAKDPRGNVWAIAGWRNVIPQYSINGAVTEMNAECSAALRAVGHLTENLGGPAEEAQGFFEAAAGIRAAMDTHLLNPENGLYYLNIDVDGNIHTDVTGDQIFPVMLRVCDEETGFRIISRLNSPDFWTPAGLRTASQNDPLYDPFAYVGLIGGVWPGLTWWYAFAAARYHPNFMVEALRSSFQHYAAAPKTNNTVPGQFSEWFDGESLINRGMRLSPWEPPRFLWAAVEGVCGLMLTTDRPRVNPLIPPEWKWVALRRFPYHGHDVTYFAAQQNGGFTIYSDTSIDSEHQVECYDDDVTEDVHLLSATAEAVALRRSDGLVVLIGNVGEQTSVIPINLRQLLESTRLYSLRIYNSERGAWDIEHDAEGEKIGVLAVSVEAYGYRIIDIRVR